MYLCIYVYSSPSSVCIHPMPLQVVKGMLAEQQRLLAESVRCEAELQEERKALQKVRLCCAGLGLNRLCKRSSQTCFPCHASSCLSHATAGCK